MAIFPKCRFELDFEGPGLVPGEDARGAIVITNEEDIPRAREVTLAFRSDAWARYGHGKSKRTRLVSIARREARIPVLERVLPAGTHRFPFAFDMPEAVPSAIAGARCGIGNVIDVALVVDWAFDPRRSFPANVHARPRHEVRTPVVIRDRSGIELTLDSSVVELDEPVCGQIALRTALDTNIDYLEIRYKSEVRIAFARGDRREGAAPVSAIRIPAKRLRDGRAVTFAIPPGRGLEPTSRNSYIEHRPSLVVRAHASWARDTSFEVPIEVLPAGSEIDRGDFEAPLVGSARLRSLAASLAEAAVLEMGELPVLVGGRIGPVALRLRDAPRRGMMGVDLEFEYPDLNLGIELTPAGALSSLRRSRLLPDELRDVQLRVRAENPNTVRLLSRTLADLGDASALRMSDTALSFHVPLLRDEVADLAALASFARTRAEVIGRAIEELAFPPALAPARAAWEATAAEEGAWLVPSGPALHGIVMRARVTTGEERVLRATIRTVDAQAEVDFDLAGAPLPALATDALRARFPLAVVHSPSSVTLRALAWPSDPRELFPLLDTFWSFVLDARAERRASGAYR